MDMYLLAILKCHTYSKAQIDEIVANLAGGVHYKGAVNYYDDLPSNPSPGDAYTVRYAGTSGTVADGTEYAWGKLDGVMQWINFSKDCYSKAETDALLEPIETNILSIQQTIGDINSVLEEVL